MNEFSLDIDNIVIDDLEISPNRAERIRELVRIELERILEREGLSGRGTNGRLSSIAAPALGPSDLTNDTTLARGIALRIARSIQGNI